MKYLDVILSITQSLITVALRRASIIYQTIIPIGVGAMKIAIQIRLVAQGML